MFSSFNNKKRGFTLIELLVVMGIIGLLVTLNLVAIMRYRDKARDSRVQGTLSQVRISSALMLNEGQTYTAVCTGAPQNTLNDAIANLKIIKDDTFKFNGGTAPLCYVNASALAYCVSSPLTASPSDYCVDSTGYAGTDLSKCGPAGFCSAP